MRAAGRGRRRGGQRRRADEGTCLDRQVHARHPQQGSRVVPPEGRAEPRVDRRDALLVISDVAVIPLPDFKQKIKQIGYLAKVANLLGIETPKIACIAPSEQLLPSVISSTEGALLAKMGARGQLGNVIIDGGGELAAMVAGTKVPCVLTSRGDTSKTKLYSIALACLAVKQ